jgi:hypothetical protein
VLISVLVVPPSVTNRTPPLGPEAQNCDPESSVTVPRIFADRAPS